MRKLRLPNMILLPEPITVVERVGWQIDNYSTSMSVKPMKLVPVRFLRRSEEYIDGKTMLRRGKYSDWRLGHLAGQEHAQALLKQQDKIPAEWRDISLVFGGTVWVNYERYRQVPAMYFDSGGVERWILDYFGLENDNWTDEECRLIRERDALPRKHHSVG